MYQWEKFLHKSTKNHWHNKYYPQNNKSKSQENHENKTKIAKTCKNLVTSHISEQFINDQITIGVWGFNNNIP